MTDKFFQGRKIPPQKEFSRDVEYTFALKLKELKIRETLYVADRMRKPVSASHESSDEENGDTNHERESHYRYDHPKNSGECE